MINSMLKLRHYRHKNGGNLEDILSSHGDQRKFGMEAVRQSLGRWEK